MKKYIQHIAASLLALSTFVGCTQQTRQLVNAPSVQPPSLPVPVSSAKTIPADTLMAPASTVPSSLPQIPATQQSHNNTLNIVGSNHVTATSPAIVATDNVTLLIDSGAVSHDVEISILATTEEQSGAIPDHLANLTADGAVYRMLPDGQQFERDITIAMRYDSSALPYGYTADDIYTFFFNEQTQMWQQVARDSVDTHNQIVYSRTNHFTDYINGVLKVPENSDVTTYTPTTIKDLKAADPMEGITLIAPPEANNQGTANLSYPLTIPAGRHGMQPKLSINYNSAGGSGILGLGWSLPISEISVETRWGVPLFDQKYETEGYILDGTTLVTSRTDDHGHFRLNKPVYHRSYELRHDADTMRFYPRVEGAFRKIERVGRTTKSYYWIVTDKDGTRHYYGRSEQSKLRDYKGNIAKWMLEKSVDTYGNTVNYSYITKGTSSSNQPSSKQICINTIRYTGFEGSNDKGQYFIRFKYFNKDDKSNSFRYGFEEINNYILDRIEVKYRDTIVREYYFGYKKGAFGKTLLGKIIEVYDDVARSQLYQFGHEKPMTIYGASPYERYGLELTENLTYLNIFHEFDYYNIEGDSLFGNPVTFDANWSGEDGIANVFNRALTENGNIGGSSSSGFNIGGSLNFGTDYFAWLKTISAGGHYSFSKDHSDGFMMLVDIDGDGYPDKLYRDLQGHLKCRLQVPGENRFDIIRDISGVSKFQETSNSTHNWGIEASVLGIIGGGANWSDSRSNTSVYVSDINGDGLIDIVDNGSVYLNKGNLIFEDVTDNDVVYVGGTCENDAYVISGEVDTTLFDDGTYIVEKIVCEQEIDSAWVYDTVYKQDGSYEVFCNGRVPVFVIDTCWSVFDTLNYTYPRRYEPDIDLVRMWKAPYSGTVRISGNARLSKEQDTFRLMTRTRDGVDLSIQKASDTYLTSSITLVPGMDTAIVDTISVVAGDTIYFRIGDADKRLYDDVVWNPHIKYTSVSLRNNAVVTDFNTIDANGDSVYAFDYGEDFMLDGVIPVSVGDTASGVVCNDTFEVRLDMVLSTPLSQDIVYSIVKKSLDSSARESIRYMDTIRVGDTIDHTFLDTVCLRSDSCLSLRLSALNGGQVKWSSIGTKATVTLLASSSQFLNSCLHDTNMNGTFVYHPAVDREYYDYQILPASTFSNISGDHNLYFTVTPQDSLSFNGNLLVTIKDETHSSYFRDVIYINNNTASVNLFDHGFSFDSQKTYRVDCYIMDSSRTADIKDIRLNIDSLVTNANVGLYAKYAPDILKHHGTLYRGWGQFGYKRDDTNYCYIKRDLTKAADFYTNSAHVPHPNDINDINTLDTNSVISEDNPEMSVSEHYYNPLAGSFFEMNADGVHNRWVSYGNAVSSYRNLCSLSGDDPDVENGDTAKVDMFQSPVPVVIPGQKMKAVNKMTLNKGCGYTIITISENRGNTRLLGDYMDLNGDRHPDIVSEAQIQYSKAQGGLSNKKSAYSGNINATTNSSCGYTFNGTFLNAAQESSNNPKKTHVYTKTTGQIPSIGINKSEDNTDNTFMDVNGDGLPDIVYSTGNVKYNMGYGFTEPRQLSTISAIRSSHSTSKSLSAGINVANTSISGGLSFGESDNRTTFALMDVNGDGLLDELSPNSIRVNMGDGTFEPYNTASPISDLDYSHSISFSLNASITYDALFMIVYFPLKFGGGISGGGSASLSYSKAEFSDMNNDGFVDYVFKDQGQINVRYSKIGKANLLKSVTNFANAKTQIDYELSISDKSCPQRHWNMSTLTVFDGHDGDSVSTIYKRFEYGNRHYDRFERDDYGYDTVKTYDYASQSDFNTNSTNSRYRTYTQEFYNDNYYHTHLKKNEGVSNGTAYVITNYTYADADIQDGHYLGGSTPAWCEGDGWPAVAMEEVFHNEGSGGIITTKREYTYGSFGNITDVAEFGDTADTSDDYTVHLSYALDSTRYIVANVSELNIPGYRHRKATYNTEGSLARLIIDNSPNSPSVYSYKYDPYGNVANVVTPAVSYTTDSQYRIDYEYDSLIHMLPIMVKNAEGHTSFAKYSFRWQKPTVTTDIHNNLMRYTIDSHGRTSTITAPNELANNIAYTVKYDYWYSHKFQNSNIDSIHGIPYRFWARTSNYDICHPGNDINTITFSDGLARIIQVKKDVEVNGEEVRAVGSTVHYDGLGRKCTEFFLRQESDSLIYDTLLNNQPASWQVKYSYDFLDRNVNTFYADGTSTSNAYSISPDNNGINRYRNDATDQNNNTSIIYTDPRQSNIQITNALGHSTMFYYDAIGQLLQSEDPEGNTTTHTYDLGGRRTDRIHPSAGHTHWDYDAAGNMVKQTQNSGEYIMYDYDYSRPIRINYSNRPWNNVWYEYGPAGSGNESGRLIRQQDATGVQLFRYDNMGNVIYNRHTYVQPHSPNTFTLETQWEYDSWGRVNTIVYPDQEKVRYFYDHGGNVCHIEGNKNNTIPTIYIDTLLYDIYEQRTYQRYGNGVETHYKYDPANRRLNRLYDNSTQLGQLLQYNTYKYDNVGNIISIDDNGLNTRRQDFEYDSINRLVFSNGSMDCQGTSLNYSTNYTYSAAGRILKKNVTSQRMNTTAGFYSMDYQNNYTYPSLGNPFAVELVHDTLSGNTINLEWDANGNMIHSICNSPIYVRHLCWTEDNRLQGYSEYSDENGNMSAWYNYNADGDRNFKITSPSLNMRQNAAVLRNDANLKYPTLYASALITFNKGGYTKHYFEGANRICSKIGGGFLLVQWDSITNRVPALAEDYDQQSAWQRENVDVTFGECLGMGVEHERIIDFYDVIKHESELDAPEPTFFYHSDHLGSAAYLSNDAGQVTQTLNYLPYGEDWVDIQNYAETRYPRLGQYTFNGKEKDYESGFHYYGARYYWSEVLTGWLSVDPLSDKYPSISPYAYCAWNPVKLVDPDGMEIDDYYNLKGDLIKHTSEGNNKYLVLTNGNDVIDDKKLAVPSKTTIDKMEGIFSSRSLVEKGIAVETSGYSSNIISGTENRISSEQWTPAFKEIGDHGGEIDYLIHLHPLNLREQKVGSPNPSEIDRSESNFFNSKLGVILSYEQKYDVNRTGTSLNEKDYIPTVSFYNSSSNDAIYKMSFRSFKQLVSKINK